MVTSIWTRTAVAAIGAEDARLHVLREAAIGPVVAGLDLWDMWQIEDATGATLARHGRTYWFFLAVPRAGDPELRHDHARIHLLSHGGDGWRDHGSALPDGATPGSREWSGSARLAPDGETLTLYFTAAGDRQGGPRFAQRLYAIRGRLVIDPDSARCDDWSTPVETVVADGHWYACADQDAPVDGGILGFRDPGYVRDPADGQEYLLFTGSAVTDGKTGVIGIARRDAAQWTLLPPLLEAPDVNSELERAHVIVRNGRYYLFWSTQGRRFAEGLVAPTGLYGMVADQLLGPYRPVNGTGLVAGNPEQAPFQAYCWWVTAEGDVASFIDYPGSDDPHAATPEARRARFGGVAAPFFQLRFDGDAVTIG
ncbi:glycoside hydrolase family 68 protein [Sphingomonas sp. PAMC 26605]|uniref:glycoside hydrolase family 68 protein n=1 Tax=Sphingomonas sp. PAMC 26605 TaxID=1112214 RepID=UPI00026CD5E0|nr:glycoside hydrolase family 68 protein [Sphingomonas sp. PAMC 26605]